MDDTELLSQLGPWIPEEFNDANKQLAVNHLREITGKPYEQIAILMAIQQMAVESLIKMLELSEKERLKEKKNGESRISIPITRRRF